MRYPGSPFGEAQKGTSPTSPQGLPGQGASGTSTMILPPDKLTGWHPASSMPGRRDISGCDLTSSTTASPCPLHPPVLANLPQPTKTSRKGCKLAGALTSLTEKCGMAMWELWQQNPNRTPTEPQQIPKGTCRGERPTAQQNSEKKSPNHTQGHWGQRGCPRHLPARRSLPSPCSEESRGYFLPEEVSLFCDISAAFDGDKAFFVAIRCCLTIYPPRILVGPKFAVFLSWLPFHVGEENQAPDGKKPHPRWELGRKEEEKAAGCPKAHHFPAAGRGRDTRMGNGKWRDTEQTSSLSPPSILEIRLPWDVRATISQTML